MYAVGRPLCFARVFLGLPTYKTEGPRLLAAAADQNVSRTILREVNSELDACDVSYIVYKLRTDNL